MYLYIKFQLHMRNMDFFKAGEFLELGHFDKHSPIARERKAPQCKNLRVFCLEILKNFILNDKFYLKMTTIRAFFLQIKALFSNFQNRPHPTPPSSDAPELNCFFTLSWNISVKEIFSFQKLKISFSEILLQRKLPHPPLVLLF